MGVGPPSGTVTFLLTDIEGSTRRWETGAEGMRAALVLHDEMLQSAIETGEHGLGFFEAPFARQRIQAARREPGSVW